MTISELTPDRIVPIRFSEVDGYIDRHWYRQKYLSFLHEYFVESSTDTSPSVAIVHLIAMKAAKFSDNEIAQRVGLELEILGLSDLITVADRLEIYINHLFVGTNRSYSKKLRIDHDRQPPMTFHGLMRLMGRRDFLELVYSPDAIEELERINEVEES